jgi:glycosyltransferase involved in cell wall biosynthesis
MKTVLFFQNKDDNLSINLLFDIIKQELAASLTFSTVYFSYKGPSLPDRINDVVLAGFKSRKSINHVIGDFNYATFFMPGGTTILTIHDLYRLYLHKSSPVKTFIFKWSWLRMPVSKSVVVTAVSQYTRNEILQHVNCDPAKIRVIYNCISPDFKPLPKLFNKQLPVILQMGTRANKNLDRLAAAIEGLACKLDIVGEPAKETLALLEQYKIDYSWSSLLTKEVIIQKYNDCDMLVFASTYEGFGMPIIEANMVERPVVTGNVSAMPEIAGSAACLVDPLDIVSIRSGINRVIADDAYREQLIEAGKRNRERFTVKNIASQYFELYKEVDAGQKKYSGYIHAVITVIVFLKR